MSETKQNGRASTSLTGVPRLIFLMDKAGGIIEAVSGAFCVALIALMTIVVLIGVHFRYIVGNPFMWTEELARFLMLWSGFLAINIAMRRDAHIRIDFIFKALPAVPRKIVEIIVDVLMTIFLVYLVFQGYQMATGSIMNAMSMDFSMFWIYMAVPLGALLTLVQLVIMILKKTLLALTQPVVLPGQ